MLRNMSKFLFLNQASKHIKCHIFIWQSILTCSLFWAVLRWFFWFFMLLYEINRKSGFISESNVKAHQVPYLYLEINPNLFTFLSCFEIFFGFLCYEIDQNQELFLNQTSKHIKCHIFIWKSILTCSLFLKWFLFLMSRKSFKITLYYRSKRQNKSSDISLFGNQSWLSHFFGLFWDIFVVYYVTK